MISIARTTQFLTLHWALDCRRNQDQVVRHWTDDETHLIEETAETQQGRTTAQQPLRRSAVSRQTLRRNPHDEAGEPTWEENRPAALEFIRPILQGPAAVTAAVALASG